mgnify:CR=1 FL=1
MPQPATNDKEQSLVAEMAARTGVPIDPADRTRLERMVSALWTSGHRIRFAFDDDVSVMPLTAVPDQNPGATE